VMKAPALVAAAVALIVAHAGEAAPMESTSATTTYHRVTVDGVGVFYREAGPKDAPTIVLLHGFPSSSREFDTLIPLLATRYHLVEPGQVLPTIRDLGLRHVAYGVELADYEALREALLWALEQALGEECTPAVRDAWTARYNELAGAMKTAAIGA
jgi:hypothetical protein